FKPAPRPIAGPVTWNRGSTPCSARAVPSSRRPRAAPTSKPGWPWSKTRPSPDLLVRRFRRRCRRTAVRHDRTFDRRRGTAARPVHAAAEIEERAQAGHHDKGADDHVKGVVAAAVAAV